MAPRRDHEPTAPELTDVGPPPPGARELASIAPLIRAPRGRPWWRRWWSLALWCLVSGAALVGLGGCRIDAHARHLLAQERADGAAPGVVRPGWGPIELGPADAEVAVLLVHGFRSTPRDFGSLPERLAERGVRVRAMLLPGHGTSSEELATATAEQWFDAVRRERDDLLRRHPRVRVAGFSLGGALALVALADDPPERLALVAPYFRVASRWWLPGTPEGWNELGRRLVDYVDSGPTIRGVTDPSAVRDFPYYRVLPLDAVAESARVAERARDPELLASYRGEVLAVVSTGDTIVDPDAARSALGGLTSARVDLHEVTESNHVLLWDRDAERVVELLVPFLTRP